MSTRKYRYETAWGTGTIEVDGDVVVGTTAPEQPARSDARTLADARTATDLPAAAQAYLERLDAMLDGEPVDVLLDLGDLARSLDWHGVDGFRRRALIELSRVPFGTVVRYGELAELAGNPRAARAAGSACATNPLPLAVPCHRVVPASGGVGQYGGITRERGAEYKRRLLALEGVAL